MKRKIRVTKSVDMEIDIDDKELEALKTDYKTDEDSIFNYISRVSCDKENNYYEYDSDMGTINFSSVDKRNYKINVRCSDIDFECENI